MKRDLLEQCVDALRALRARKHKELGASVTTELDDVIRRLERCLKIASDEALVGVKLRERALETLSRCLNLTTNLAEIIRWFFGPE